MHDKYISQKIPRRKLININNLKKVLIRVPVAEVETEDDQGQDHVHVHVLAHVAVIRTANVATAGAVLVQIAKVLVESRAVEANRLRGKRIAPSRGKLLIASIFKFFIYF